MKTFTLLSELESSIVRPVERMEKNGQWIIYARSAFVITKTDPPLLYWVCCFLVQPDCCFLLSLPSSLLPPLLLETNDYFGKDFIIRIGYKNQ